jgi:polysaccharide export outer membrane protein
MSVAKRFNLLFLAVLCLAIPASGEVESLEEAQAYYTLRRGDIVSITVFNEGDLSVSAKLDPDGVLVVPLLGRTRLAGYTMREAEAFLEQKFIDEEFLIKPQVSVSVVNYAEQVFYAFGEVNSPGAKPFPEGKQSLDILEAITMAGDLGQYAKRSEVTIRRPIEGVQREEKIIVDLDKVIRGSRRGREELVEVYPNDILFVPQRLF